MTICPCPLFLPFMHMVTGGRRRGGREEEEKEGRWPKRKNQSLSIFVEWWCFVLLSATHGLTPPLHIFGALSSVYVISHLISSSHYNNLYTKLLLTFDI